MSESMNRRYWDPKYEDMAAEELGPVQLKNLRSQVSWVYHHSPFYRRSFDAAGVVPGRVKTLSDIERLPFIDKSDYERSQAGSPPYGEMLCVSQELLTRHWTTSGSTGQPRVVGTTTEDYRDLVESGARVLWAGGVRPGDRVMIPQSHGPLVGLWGVYDAAWSLVGAQAIPVGGVSTQKRAEMVRDMGFSTIVCTPSYAAYLTEVAQQELSIDTESTAVKSIMIAGEPASPATRDLLETAWGARTVEFFGTTENYSYHGVECEARDGIHFWEDRIVTEIVDPESGAQLPKGEFGELVITNLSSKSMPAIRFRTGDLTAIAKDACKCGSAHNRIQYLQGRLEQVVKIRGLNVYPRVVEDIIRSVPGLGSEYRIILETERHLDGLRLQVEALNTNAEEESRVRDQLLKRVRGVIGIGANIEVLEHGTLPVSEGKGQRIIDKRNQLGVSSRDGD